MLIGVWRWYGYTVAAAVEAGQGIEALRAEAGDVIGELDVMLSTRLQLLDYVRTTEPELATGAAIALGPRQGYGYDND